MRCVHLVRSVQQAEGTVMQLLGVAVCLPGKKLGGWLIETRLIGSAREVGSHPVQCERMAISR